MTDTVSTATPAPGFFASALVNLINFLTWLVKFVVAIATYVRRFASWFKSNYWHAFVVGLAVMWLAMVSRDLTAHPVTWSAWLASKPAEKMLGIPVTMDPLKEAVKAVEAKKDKKPKKVSKRTDDAPASFKFF